MSEGRAKHPGPAPLRAEAQASRGAEAPPVYLDHHATTPCDARVLEAMLPLFREDFGNASSAQHAPGRRAGDHVERARAQVAALLGADPREIVFTSGATESNHLALLGVLARVARDSPREIARHLITSVVEHRSILDACTQIEREGVRVTYLPVDSEGLISPEQLEAAIEPETCLVSIQWANNETGVVQPLAALGAVCRARGVLFHSDAVQALPWLEIDVANAPVDLLSISAHKMYGPKGVGALYVRRRSPRARLEPLLRGGGQESGLRAGTLNTPGIVGLGAASAIVHASRAIDARRVADLRDALLERLLRIDGATLRGSPRARLPNNLSVSFAGLEARAIVSRVERVAVSSGSACSASHEDGSYVLRALGVEDWRHGAVRIGLGRGTTSDEISLAADELARAVDRVRKEGVGPVADTCEI